MDPLSQFLDPNGNIPDNNMDAAVRTAFGEGANQPSAAQQAIVATAVNRAAANGTSVQQELLRPNQYQAWQNPQLRSRMESLSPTDPQYAKIQAAIQPVMNGSVKLPYTHYLNRASTPAGASALTSWASQPGEKIGDQEFYSSPAATPQHSTDLDHFLSGDDTPSAATAASTPTLQAGAPGAPPPAANDDPQAPYTPPPGSLAAQTIADAKGDGSVLNANTGQAYNAAQTAFFNANRDKLNPNATPGSAQLPYAQTSPDAKPTNPGDYYVDLGGNIQRVPLTAAQQKAHDAAEAQVSTGGAGASLFNGLLQGFGPEAIGAGRALAAGVTGGDMADTYAQSRDVAREQLGAYANAHPIASGVATAGGSLLTAAPAIAAGGAGLEALGARAALGPTGEFLAGVAGRTAEGEAAPGVTNMLLRAGSRAANAAVQGAAGGAIASHLNPNTPLAEQMALGAAGGAAFQGAGDLAGAGGNLLMRIPAVGDTVRSFTEPLTQAGREAIANRVLGGIATGGPTAVDASQIVPGSAPTLAVATGNRGLMAAEKAMRGTPEGANVFGLIDAGNDAARRDAAFAIRGDNDTLADLQAQRANVTQPLLADAFASPQATTSGQVVRAIDAALASPSGKIDSVATPLQNIRAKLFNDDAGISAADQRALNSGVMSTMGSEAVAPTQAAMNEARQRIGSVFERVASGTPVQADDALMNRLGEIDGDAERYLTDSDAKPVHSLIDDIVKAGAMGDNNTIPGEAYQALTKKGSPLDRAMGSSNSNVSVPAQQIRDALDDALERSANPEDLQALQQARTQYRNLKIVQSALDKTQPGQPLQPSALLSSVRKAYPNFSFTGGGDLGSIAQQGLAAQAKPASFVSDPEQLYGVRRAVDAMLEPKLSDETAGETTAHLQRIQGMLDDAIEQGAPGYKAFVAANNAATTPINAQNFLLSKDLIPVGGSAPTAARANALLNAIDRGQRATGPNGAKDVTENTIQAIRALRDDLVRSNLTPDRNIRSDTFQNLATNSVLGRLGIPTMGAAVMAPGVGTAAKFAHNALMGLYESQNPKITNTLLQKLANPEYGAQAFAPSVQLATRPNGPVASVLGAFTGQGVGNALLVQPRAIPLPAF